MAENLTIDGVKRHFQQHLTSGLVVIVGSGLSCAEGLPGMGQIADRLAKVNLATYPYEIKQSDWDFLVRTIADKGLEPALKEVEPSPSIADLIRAETAKYIWQEEQVVVREVLTGTRQLRFSRFVKHLPAGERSTVITTNYDRLIELGAEAAGFMVDSRSFGHHCGHFSKTEWAFAFTKSVVPINRGFRKIEASCISLYKPHGSLDWRDYNGTAIRFGFDVDVDRALIVTPGRNKYRAGYDQPFDMHRELANQAIDRAARLLIIGYGFNDDHLETHLGAHIRAGVPTLILSRSLTPTARAYLSDSPAVWAVEAVTGADGTLVHNQDKTLEIPGEQIWDLSGFVKGVMNDDS